MFAFLKQHPFAVEAFFESSLILTYAVPMEELQSMIPDCLTLDTFDGKWGFIAVAVVQTKHLRPKGFPSIMGNNFVLTGYRIFVRYTTSKGKKLRGLYILKSETNKLKMEILGNFFTRYSYQTTDISYEADEASINVRSTGSGLKILADVKKDNAQLPLGSPFNNWKEARRFAGPLPFTFSFDQKTNRVLIVEGVREDWEPTPVEIVEAKSAFIDQMAFKAIKLANAFTVKNIPYSWKKGRVDQWIK